VLEIIAHAAKARAELAELAKLKRRRRQDAAGELDYAFYEDQLVKARYALDPEAVRAYLRSTPRYRRCWGFTSDCSECARAADPASLART